MAKFNNASVQRNYERCVRRINSRFETFPAGVTRRGANLQGPTDRAIANRNRDLIRCEERARRRDIQLTMQQIARNNRNR